MDINKRVKRIEEYLRRKGEHEDPIKAFYQNSREKGSKYESLYAGSIASEYGCQDRAAFLKEYPEVLREHLWDLCGEALKEVGQKGKVDVAALEGELTPEKLRGQLTEFFKIGIGIER